LGQVLMTPEGGLGITVFHNDDGVLVRLDGHTTVDSSPDLLDLTGVDHVDASGIATLIEALKIARHRQTTFCLQGLRGSALRLFEVTGVLALFESSDCGQKGS
jgi:anti-anti-sigma factor